MLGFPGIVWLDINVFFGCIQFEQLYDFVELFTNYVCKLSHCLNENLSLTAATKAQTQLSVAPDIAIRTHTHAHDLHR